MLRGRLLFTILDERTPCWIDTCDNLVQGIDLWLRVPDGGGGGRSNLGGA